LRICQISPSELVQNSALVRDSVVSGIEDQGVGGVRDIQDGHKSGGLREFRGLLDGFIFLLLFLPVLFELAAVPV